MQAWCKRYALAKSFAHASMCERYALAKPFAHAIMCKCYVLVNLLTYYHNCSRMANSHITTFLKIIHIKYFIYTQIHQFSIFDDQVMI